MKTTTEAELKQMAADGMSAKAIAKELDCGVSSLYCALSLLGIKAGKAVKVNPHIELIMSNFSTGLTLAETAKQLDVSQSNLHYALKIRGLPTTVAGYVKWRANQ